MTKEQMQVKEFMVKGGQSFSDSPTIDVNPSVCQLRSRLIHEELKELDDALVESDCIGDFRTLVAIADALGDLLYVVIGAGVVFGIDLDEVFQEIHSSNMTKFKDGHRREDGKWMKGPSYRPVNLGPILIEQMKRAQRTITPETRSAIGYAQAIGRLPVVSKSDPTDVTASFPGSAIKTPPLADKSVLGDNGELSPGEPFYGDGY